MSASNSRSCSNSELTATIDLACQCISRLGNAEDEDRPRFGHETPFPGRGDSRFFFSGVHDESHVPGRHLLALLEAETLGVKPSVATVNANRRALEFSMSREIPLPQNRASLHAVRPTRFLPHNVRESIHGYLALYLHRRNDAASYARSAIGRICSAIDTFWDPLAGWDPEAMVSVQPDLELIEWASPHITGLARAIGPLTRFVVAANKRDEPVPVIETTLQRIVASTLPYYPVTGVAADLGTHTHSITSVLSGLAKYADWRGDDDLMSRVEAFYRLGLTQYADQIGWSIENAGKPSDRGELNNSGDIVETALTLARWRHSSYYDDIELIIRAHILPAQLMNGGFMAGHEVAARGLGDAGRNVAGRLAGAFGFPAPYGHLPFGTSSISFNTDIVGGVVSSLVQYSVSVEQSDEELRIDCRVSRTRRVVIRLPAWVIVGTVRVFGAERWRVDGGRLEADVSSHSKAATVVVTCSVQRRRIDLGHVLQPIAMIISGARVVAADALGQPLPFFPPLSSGPIPAELASHQSTMVAVGTSLRLHSGATAQREPTTITFPGKGAFAVCEPRQQGDFGSGSFTLALWVKSHTVRGRILSKSSTDDGCGYFLRFKGTSGQLEFCVGGGTLFGGAGKLQVTSDGSLGSGTWHHLAVTVDVLLGRLTLYLDRRPQRLSPASWTQGISTGTGLRFPPTIRATASSVVPLMLATRLGTDEFFQGSMAGVVLVDKALAEEQLGELLESTYPDATR